MSELELLGPAIAVLALFAVVALSVQVFRLGRAVRRLSDRLDAGGGAAQDLPVARLQEIGAQPAAASPSRRPSRLVLVGGAGALLTLVAAGAALFLVTRGDEGSPGGEPVAASPSPAPPVSTPDPAGTVPATPPALGDKSAFTVLVLNASGVDGAAREKVAPLLATFGYQVPAAVNAPTSDFEKSVVMFSPGNRALAQNVASDLRIEEIAPRDGFDLRGADAAVFVGRDLARRPAVRP